MKKKIAFVKGIIVSAIAISALLANSKSREMKANENNRSLSLPIMNSGANFDKEILNEFKDASLKQESTFACFEGSKSFNPHLSDFETVAMAEEDDSSNVTTKYRVVYDKESNVVSIKISLLTQEEERTIIDIRGVGFFDSNGEIDAVMNVDGKGVLLSEMRGSRTIENCNWFSDFLGKVAVAAGVVALTAAAVAVVVSTGGALAPAVIGAAVATKAAATTAALAIAKASLATAAAAAGVATAVDSLKKQGPSGFETTNVTNGQNGFSVTQSVNANTFRWGLLTEKERASIQEEVLKLESTKRKEEQRLYFKCEVSGCDIGDIQRSPRYTLGEMAIMMNTQGMSSFTFFEAMALAVITAAFPDIGYFIEKNDNGSYHRKSQGVYHYHATENFFNNEKTIPNPHAPRIRANKKSVHSYFASFEKPPLIYG